VSAEPVEYAVLAPGGDLVLTVHRTVLRDGSSYSSRGTARLWDKEGKVLAEVDRVRLGSSEPENECAGFSPSGDRFLLRMEGYSAMLFDRAGKRLATFRHDDDVTHAVFNPRGDRVLTASDDETARLWDLAGHRLALLRGHEGPVHSVDVSPGGDRLATASADGTIRLWDLSGHQILSLACGAGVGRCRFSPSGKKILASLESRIDLWDFDPPSLLQALRSRLPRDFTDEEVQVYGSYLAVKRVEAEPPVARLRAAVARALRDADWEAAEAAYARLAEVVPGDAMAALGLARASLLRGAVANGLAALDAALANLAAEDCPVALRMLARELYAQEAWAAAEGVLRRIVDRSPGDAGSHARLGEILVRTGRFADAVASFDRALAAAAGRADPEVRQWRGLRVAAKFRSTPREGRTAEDPVPVVNEVDEGSAAAKAGVKEGDVVLRFAEIDVTRANDFREGWSLVERDEPAQITLWRDGAEVRVTLKGGRTGMRLGDF